MHFMDETDDKPERLIPPKKTAADAIDAVVDAVIQAVPGIGSSTSTLINEYIPSPIEKKRGQWEEDVSSTVNQHSDQLDQLADTNQVTVTDLSADILERLITSCPDGMADTHYDMDKLIEFFPGEVKADIKDACNELFSLGLVSIRNIPNCWDVRLSEDSYEVLDRQIMDWDTVGDAKAIANIVVNTKQSESRSLCHELGWTTRRFNPALRVLVESISDQCVREVDGREFYKRGFVLTSATISELRLFIKTR